jgi:DNA-binding NarL/FixJ family response regulator
MRSFHILVVEDFKPFRQFVCRTLRQTREFRVTEASDGLEAIRKTDRLQPDVILLDIGLPNLNGFEVAMCVPKLAPAAKILFLSQEFSPELVLEALKKGAEGYVPKLRLGNDLLTAITTVLKGKRFVSSGFEIPPSNGYPSTTTTYPWQREVNAAFQAPAKFLPTAISAAERKVAARLKDQEQKDLDEVLALRRALRSLEVLIDETIPPEISELGEKKKA